MFGIHGIRPCPALDAAGCMLCAGAASIAGACALVWQLLHLGLLLRVEQRHCQIRYRAVMLRPACVPSLWEAWHSVTVSVVLGTCS